MPIVDEILQLSPIIQGALGSALFGIAFWLVKKIYSFIQNRVIYINKELRINSLNSDLVRLTALESGDPSINSFALIGLLYNAFAYFIKAIICICIGAVLDSFIPIFQNVSFVFALYFLYQALDSVKDSFSSNREERIEELKEEVQKLKAM